MTGFSYRRSEGEIAAAEVTGSSASATSSTFATPTSTPDDEGEKQVSGVIRQTEDVEFPKLPFRFETGIGLFAKRTPRPFPPPFLSPPSGSFSDPLSTHNRSRDRRQAFVDGQLIRGYTNGDDAVFASGNFIGVDDGVGAWSMRPRGHAGFVTFFSFLSFFF